MGLHGSVLRAAALWSPIPLLGGALVYHTGVPEWIVGTQGSYERRVEQPVPVVAAALKDIETDQFDQHGNASVPLDLPQIVRLETADGFNWQIVKDGKVTVEMTAKLKPANGGAATDVIGSVKLIGADHAVSAPAFRLLFTNALDAKLMQLGAPSGLGADEVRRKKQFGDSAMGAAALLEDPLAPARAGLQVEEDEMRNERELLRQREISEANRGVNFRPGEPMINVDPNHRPAE